MRVTSSTRPRPRVWGPAPVLRYDASKHAVVALTEDLYTTLGAMGAPVGVSVLCPGWVRTQIMDAQRNWPGALGELPPPALGSDVVRRHISQALDDGMTPAAIADQVADAITARRYWILPGQEFVEFLAKRWASITEGRNPEIFRDVPGLPPGKDIAAEIAAVLNDPQ